MITLWEVAGYLASGLVIAAFCMKDVITLRALALASNFAFLIYGIGRRDLRAKQGRDGRRQSTRRASPSRARRGHDNRSLQPGARWARRGLSFSVEAGEVQAGRREAPPPQLSSTCRASLRSGKSEPSAIRASNGTSSSRP
jgi:hypothetical protein